MKLEDVMKYAAKPGANSPKGDVLLSVNKGNNNSECIRLKVYKEPNGCNFFGTSKWTVAYHPERHRLYVMYGNDKRFKMYKVQDHSWIQFTENPLLVHLKANSVKRTWQHWSWDSECTRAYIDLSEITK